MTVDIINVGIKRKREKSGVSDQHDDSKLSRKVVSEDQKVSNLTLPISLYKPFDSMSPLDKSIGHGKECAGTL